MTTELFLFKFLSNYRFFFLLLFGHALLERKHESLCLHSLVFVDAGDRLYYYANWVLVCYRRVFLMALRIFIPIIYIICILFHFFIPVYIRTLLFLYFWDCRWFCSNCSVDFTTKPEECQCCREIDRSGEVMERFGDTTQCITLHTGFQDVCLNQHARFRSSSIGTENKIWKVVPSIVWSRT